MTDLDLEIAMDGIALQLYNENKLTADEIYDRLECEAQRVFDEIMDGEHEYD